jgi:hypothetical protein
MLAVTEAVLGAPGCLATSKDIVNPFFWYAMIGVDACG